MPVEPLEAIADPPLRRDWRRHPIMLVGMMGSGKSSIGRKLAARLRWPFVDADAEIEASARMSITEIFERHGEAHFRDGERRVIARLMGGGHKVIAAGGGAFADPATRALVRERGTAIWLDAPLAVLAERVGRRSHRPLVAGRDPLPVLAELDALRRPAYAEAPLRIACGDGPPEDVVEAILAALTAAERAPR